MKQNLLTHIMRLTILFLLFFGWGTGSAVAGTGLECGGTTPTKPTALAADLADPAVGPAVLDFLSGNTEGITAAARVNRLKAWEKALDGGLVHMRVKTDFLETVSQYTRANSPVARVFSNNMSLAEEAMIRHYTTGAHNALNTAIKSGGNLSDDLLEFKNTLNTALDKLPDHVGIVHRGLDESTSIAAEFWTVGQKIQRPAFVSSSTSESVAETFMNIRGGNVTLRIESKTGKLIQDAAVNPNELEVLFKSGKEFEVLQAATPKPNNPTILEVVVKEL